MALFQGWARFINLQALMFWDGYALAPSWELNWNALAENYSSKHCSKYCSVREQTNRSFYLFVDPI
jgi:hypothetical protein